MQTFPLPPDITLSDNNGKATEEFRRWLHNFQSQVSQNLNEDGYVLPRKKTAEAEKVPLTKNGNLLLDTERGEPLITINGVVKKIMVGDL